MNEARKLVEGWRARLKALGWPEDEIRELVTALVEAGYRQAVDDMRARIERDEAIIRKAVSN